MNNKKGIVIGHIWTAKSLSKDETKDVLDYCQRIFMKPGETLQAEVKVDPTLQSGWELRLPMATHGYTMASRSAFLREMIKKEYNYLNDSMEKALKTI